MADDRMKNARAERNGMAKVVQLRPQTVRTLEEIQLDLEALGNIPHDERKARSEQIGRELTQLKLDLDRREAERTRPERERLWHAAHPQDPDEHARNVARVIEAAMTASPSTVAKMADLAMGAKAPGKTFQLRLTQLVELVRYLERDPETWAPLLIDNMIPFVALPLLDGLARDEALNLATELLRRKAVGKLTATGVVADFVLAAAQRGVQIGTFSKKSTRTQVLKVVDNAFRTYGRRST